MAADILQASIKLLAGTQSAQTGTTEGYDHTRDEGGFWASLKDAFMPKEDRYAYSEGLSRGGTLLTVSVEPSHVDTAMNILEEHGSVDLDEREASWRKEGWSGYAAGTATGATANTGAVRNPTAAEVAGGTGTMGGTAAFAAGGREAVPVEREAATGTAAGTE